MDFFEFKTRTKLKPNVYPETEPMPTPRSHKSHYKDSVSRTLRQKLQLHGLDNFARNSLIVMKHKQPLYHVASAHIFISIAVNNISSTISGIVKTGAKTNLFFNS